MAAQEWGVAVNGLDAHLTVGPFEPYAGNLLIGGGGALVPASHVYPTREQAEAVVLEHLEIALAWHESETVRLHERIASLRRVNLDAGT